MDLSALQGSKVKQDRLVLLVFLDIKELKVLRLDEGINYESISYYTVIIMKTLCLFREKETSLEERETKDLLDNL